MESRLEESTEYIEGVRSKENSVFESMFDKEVKIPCKNRVMWRVVIVQVLLKIWHIKEEEEYERN